MKKETNNDYVTCTLLMAEELGIKPSKVTLELLNIQKGGKS